MDVLSRNLVNCALACALGLVSLPAFSSAIPASDPGYLWQFDNSGAKLVFAPDSPISQNITGVPANAFTPAANAADGVIETINASSLPLGNSGLSASGISLTRGLTVGDLIDGAKALMVPDNPYGAAFLAATIIGTIALDAYDNANSSSSPPISSSNPYYPEGCVDPFSSSTFFSSPSATCTGSDSGGSLSSLSGSNPYTCYMSNGSFNVDCNGTGSSTAPSGYGSVTETPAQAIQWAQSHPNSFATNVAPVLDNSSADQISLAQDEAANNAPLPSPVPFSYLPNPNPDVITGSPTTQTSTDPTTGNTTQTTTTPSYRVSPSPSSPSVDVTKSTTVVTQTCTSSGSCTSSPPVTTTGPAQTPKLTPFVAPALSAPTTSALVPTPYALNLNMPSQSSAVCPSPLAYNAFGTAFTIPLSPLCTLATDVRPYVESLGAVGAGIVIFR